MTAIAARTGHRVILMLSARALVRDGARTSASGRVFMTCRASTPPRRAVPTPTASDARDVGAVTVAVDATLAPAASPAGGRRPCRGEWAAVHFEQRAGVAAARSTGRSPCRSRSGPTRRLVGWVITLRAGVASRPDSGATLLESALPIVERRQHDIERLERLIRKIETSVRQDVYLTPWRMAMPETAPAVARLPPPGAAHSEP